MGYFEYLYKKREVLEFSKLFSIAFEGNIFDYSCREVWEQFMVMVWIFRRKSIKV
jgi:hypothetical protein